MKIIDNKKDYYDYVSSIWGIDEKVVYDRRGSIMLTNNKENWLAKSLFSEEIIQGYDCAKRELRPWEVKTTKNIVTKKTAGYNGKFFEGNVDFFCLEVGTTHYFFEVERYIEDGKLVIDKLLLKKEEGVKRIGKTPISLFECGYSHGFMNNTLNVSIRKESELPNPILDSTWLRKELDAEEIWKNVYSYLSSLNDKDVVDNRTDKEKIESYGFDNKTSFRNM